jgi:acyl-coenzyme A synthetase/AMP-(fatty) acid ligase
VIPLARLLSTDPAPGTSVAFGREGSRDALDLARDVGSLAVSLAPVAGERLLLYCDDAYAFAVGLLAAAQVGARVVLPPSRQAGALRSLAREVAGAILDGPEESDTLEGRPCWSPLDAPAGDPAWKPAPLDRDAPLVELFTSGTTGAGKAVAKAVRHLEDEVIALEERFGGVLGAGTRILATTSPQHLYGLLFRVLWPLCAGRPFLRSSLLHPEELAPHLEDAGPFALATTPVALRRMVEKGGLAPRLGECRAIFSSGGPLPGAVARRVTERVGAPPWEIYGSTETGGVAVRQQWRGGECWRPLAPVAVAEDPDLGCLAVTSPFVSGGEPFGAGRERVVLADRVAFDGAGGFELLGRTDRMVKIGEKRLSLPAMEERLLAHPAVAEVALLPLGHGAGTRLGAVVAPTAAGWELVDVGGRRALAKALSEHVAPHFDRVLLPRAWRLVEGLPRDAQGKLPVAALHALFAGAGPAPRAPEVLTSRREACGLETRLRIPHDLAFLEGHFPGSPVVAGVVQVHFVMAALEELLGAAPRLEALEALKFQEVLLPGQEVRLRLQLAQEGPDGSARFAFTLADPEHPERLFASGRGLLGPGA